MAISTFALSIYRNRRSEWAGWRCLNRPYHQHSGNRISNPSSQKGYMTGMLAPPGAARVPIPRYRNRCST